MVITKEAPKNGRSKSQQEVYHKSYDTVADRLADEPPTLLQEIAFVAPWWVIGFMMGWIA